MPTSLQQHLGASTSPPIVLPQNATFFILNQNNPFIKAPLQQSSPILNSGPHNFVGHEKNSLLI